MEKLTALPIDWANVNWPYVVTLVLLVFGCTFVGTALGLGRPVLSSVLTALLFGTAFVFWTYYPHDLPLPTLVKTEKTSPAPPASPRPPAPVTSARPDNPVKTISPPPDQLHQR